MGFEDLEPIFGEAKSEWTHPMMFHVYAPDPSSLRFVVTDFHSSTWQALRSITQLEDLRDNIGIGGSWSEFVDYLVSSIRSEDVKLVMDKHSKSDGAINAKLIAQKTKGMPLISISLYKLVGAAASEAIAYLSLELFKGYKSTRNMLIKEQERTCQLTNVISAEQEKSEALQKQLEAVLHSKRQKFQKMNASDNANMSGFQLSSDTSSITGISNSPDKRATQDGASTKVPNRAVPAYRRAKVRGALILDTEDD